jgi:cathepsin L
MLRTAIALALVCVAFGHFTEELNLRLNNHWETFKRVHNKQYSVAEDLLRRQIFAKNVRLVIHHNIEADLGLHSFRLGVNQFADLTNTEFQTLNGYTGEHKTHSPDGEFRPSFRDLPATVDWRTKGLVTPVKNQAQCGSCWAFSAIASLEGQHANATGKLVSLSEQQLVDCSQAEGNQGCNGGLMDQAFTYIKKNQGVDTEASYPYEGTDGTCRFKKANVGATLTGFKDIPTGDENALKEASATIGPISVAIDASSFWFQLYFGGIYDHADCKNGAADLDHGVTVVGYGTENGKDYWLVKNSWGGTWGEKGYIRMVRNKSNQCGIATQASYPLV